MNNEKHAMELNTTNYDEQIGKGVVLVDFWASWCGPCRMMSPVIEELAAELSGQVLVAKVNIDENETLAARYGIMTIPTLLIMKDGEIVKQSVGVKSKEALKQELQSVITQ